MSVVVVGVDGGGSPPQYLAGPAISHLEYALTAPVHPVP